MFGRRRELDERERELNEREFRLKRWEENLQEQSEQLKVYHKEVKRLHGVAEGVVQQRSQPDPRLYAGECEWCGYDGELLTGHLIYNAETKRRKTRKLCSQECADAMDDEQRELAEGMQYVRKSLGVG